MLTYLVTGGLGFIGGALAKRLSNDGGRVIILDNLEGRSVRGLPTTYGYEVEVYPFDLSEIGRLDHLEIDWVAHFAAHYANERSLAEPIKSVTDNMVGTMHVLDFMRRKEIKKLIYASSSGVYGGKASMYRETDLPNPSTPYEVTKYGAELLCRGFAEIYGMHLLSPRFFNLYGIGDIDQKWRAVIPKFFRLAFENKPLVVTGVDGSRDFTFIDDVVDTMCTAMKEVDETPNGERVDRVFNIATGNEVKIVDLAAKIKDLCKSSSEIEIRPKRIWDNAPRRVGSIELFQKYYPDKFASMRGVDDGLAASFHWYQQMWFRRSLS